MSIDTQRFMDLTQNITTLWSSPLTIILSQYFLWQYLGPSSLAGLAFMVITIPIDALISQKLKKLQAANLKNKDSRIKIMNEVLEGIKVLKLYAWEPSFIRKIQAVRDEEIKTLKKTAILSSILTFIFTATPFFVAICSFAAYVLTGNVLTPEIAFVSLSFFNIVRMPLASFPFLIVQLIQAMVSLDRINRFLNSQETNPESISHDNDEDKAVLMQNASFTWDTDLPPTIENVTLSIRKGDLVAVVGQVQESL